MRSPFGHGISLTCAAVFERLVATRFRLWFGESVRLHLSGKGDALEVRVPDPFFREWIQNHYTTSLLEAAEAVLGRPLQLSIRIYDEIEPPLGDVVDLASSSPERESQPIGAAASSFHCLAAQKTCFRVLSRHQTHRLYFHLQRRTGPAFRNVCVA